MTDTNPGAGPAPEGQPAGRCAIRPAAMAPRFAAPFPAVRLLYAIGFGVVAWFVFWITLILALAQFVVVAINGKVNDELKVFTLNLIQYLWELLAFITFVRTSSRSPSAPFPSRPEAPAAHCLCDGRGHRAGGRRVGGGRPSLRILIIH